MITIYIINYIITIYINNLVHQEGNNTIIIAHYNTTTISVSMHGGAYIRAGLGRYCNFSTSTQLKKTAILIYRGF